MQKGASAIRALMLLQRKHASRSCRLRHALPFYRLSRFGWQPSVSSWDFAGVVWASLLYGLLAGFATAAFAAHHLFVLAPGALDLRMLGACASCGVSLVLSLLQVCCDFVGRLLADELAQAARIERAVRAEHAAGEREAQMARELHRKVETLLDTSSFRRGADAALRGP